MGSWEDLGLDFEAFRVEECNDPLIILEGKDSSRESADTSMSLQLSVSSDGMALMREHMIVSVSKSRFLHPF